MSYSQCPIQLLRETTTYETWMKKTNVFYIQSLWRKFTQSMDRTKYNYSFSFFFSSTELHHYHVTKRLKTVWEVVLIFSFISNTISVKIYWYCSFISNSTHVLHTKSTWSMIEKANMCSKDLTGKCIIRQVII